MNAIKAKCENCGTIFTPGVNGVTTNAGADLCDGCNHTIRNVAGQVIEDDWSFEISDEEMIERLR